LARGYLNLPELTAERFTPDPFGGEPGARIYNTGDRARYLADGEIEFLGRADHQVKVRGFRIELGEIEATLAQHAAIERVVVVACEEEPDDKRLIAYFVTLREPAPTAAELRAFIKDKLPDYMIPSAFVFLSRMPLTPNGKIDRKALPAPDQTLDIEHYVRPRDPLERQLTEIWEDILKVHPIGICDNFFEIGGNSLSSIRMVDRTERMIGRKIPLTAMFEKPTVEHLAALLLKQETDNAGSIVEVQKGAGKSPFFFLHGDFNGGGFYCRSLARGLGDERPFYAIQPHGLDGSPIPLTIEAMAESHLQALRGVQPRGPYLLGGYCNGAAVAFEIARLLQSQGEKIELLVLLCFSVSNALRFKLLSNLVNPSGGVEPVESEERLRRFLEYRGKLIRVLEIKDYYRGRLGEFSRMRMSERVSFVKGKTLTILTNLGSALASIQTNRNTQATSFDSPSSSSGEGDRRQLATAAYNRAILGYVPRPYFGPVTVLWPSELALEDPTDPTVGWSRVATAVEVQRVPGGHVTCLTKHVHDLAKTLKSCLDKSQGNANSPGPLEQEPNRHSG
jgi:thioesterase domain-containing protein